MAQTIDYFKKGDVITRTENAKIRTKKYNENLYSYRLYCSFRFIQNDRSSNVLGRYVLSSSLSILFISIRSIKTYYL